MQHAQANTKKQFEESPNLDQETLYAAMDSDAAFSAMTRQVLESKKVRPRLKEILMGPAALYEALRQKGQVPSDHPMA